MHTDAVIYILITNQFKRNVGSTGTGKKIYAKKKLQDDGNNITKSYNTEERKQMVKHEYLLRRCSGSYRAEMTVLNF